LCSTNGAGGELLKSAAGGSAACLQPSENEKRQGDSKANNHGRLNPIQFHWQDSIGLFEKMR
jgi:hypothetical protein